MEDKNGVSYHLFKYISCEGRYIVVYGYHFRLLQELRFGENIDMEKLMAREDTEPLMIRSNNIIHWLSSAPTISLKMILSLLTGTLLHKNK